VVETLLTNGKTNKQMGRQFVYTAPAVGAGVRSKFVDGVGANKKSK
jgi:hypothetical protein